jgi:glycine/sarcosine/betaine reductase complex component C subunit beta
VTEDDGESPIIRLDGVGKHDIGSGSSQQNIMEALVRKPLERMGMKITDVDRYATEMHNPEITVPAGSGNVPLTNYRMIGALAALGKEIDRNGIDQFVRERGMPGFAPTQGHIPAAVPFLGHALDGIKRGEMKNAMFLAKGSLFLGRMSQLSDGLSFLIERNPGQQHGPGVLTKGEGLP